jgi:hypothetical protein
MAKRALLSDSSTSSNYKVLNRIKNVSPFPILLQVAGTNDIRGLIEV